MTKEKILAATLPLLMAGAMPACAQNYVMKSASREHIIIDNRYGSTKEAENFVRPYKNIVDSVMAPLVGYSARYMKAHTPESELSNLLADIMVWGGKMYDEKPDIGLYNMGGIRAALPKGRVTFGDINDIAPFENKICFLSLSGEQLTTLFRQIGRTFGAGISHGVEAVYEKGNLVSLRLNGEEIDPKRDYRIATIDYLIHGNDGFRELRKNVAMVSQETYIFMGTVAENIAYARPDATREEIIKAAIQASAHDFICKMPQGYDTILGPANRALSGGEKQRISIARAILADPKILILDEATSAVDTETELAIQKSLEQLEKGRTVLSIAHRLSTLRNANHLIVLDNGKVTEKGTHEELLAQKGTFYKLTKLQTKALEMRAVD